MQIEIVQIVKKRGCFFRLWKFVGVSALDIGSDGSRWVRFEVYMLPWTTASSVVMLKFTVHVHAGDRSCSNTNVSPSDWLKHSILA